MDIWTPTICFNLSHLLFSQDVSFYPFIEQNLIMITTNCSSVEWGCHFIKKFNKSDELRTAEYFPFVELTPEQKCSYFKFSRLGLLSVQIWIKCSRLLNLHYSNSRIYSHLKSYMSDQVKSRSGMNQTLGHVDCIWFYGCRLLGMSATCKASSLKVSKPKNSFNDVKALIKKQMGISC